MRGGHISTYKRLPRPKKNKTADELAGWPHHLFVFVASNWKVISFLTGAVLLIAALFLISSNMSAAREERAFVSFYKAMSQKDDSQKQEAVEDVIKKYPRSAAARRAHMFLGEIFFEKGDYANALSHFEALKNQKSPLLAISAMHASAKAKRAMGDIEAAAQDYMSAALDNRNLIKEESMYLAARCYEEIKKYDEARKNYEEIIKSDSGGAFKSLSEERLLWMTANAL